MQRASSKKRLREERLEMADNVKRMKVTATKSLHLNEKEDDPFESGHMKYLSYFCLENPHARGESGLHILNSTALNEVAKFIYSQFTSETPVNILFGPPGCGKTFNSACTFLDMALLEKSSTKEFLWFNVAAQYYIRIVNKEMSQSIPLKIDTLPEITENTKAIFYDGIMSQSEKDTFHNVFWNLNIKNKNDYLFQLVITSEQSLTLDRFFKRRGYSWKEQRINPWTIDQYYLAVHDSSFFADVKAKLIPLRGLPSDFDDNSLENRKRLIDEKYAVAGNCARFMFDYSYEEVISEIEKTIEEVHSCYGLFDSGFRSSEALNTIVQVGKDANKRTHYSLVSSYVTRVISKEKTPTDVERFLERAYNHVYTNFNLAFDGWMLELDFLTAVRKSLYDRDALVGRLKDEAGLNFLIEISNFYYFHSSADLALTQALPLDNNCWYFPCIFNQGSFDAVQLVGDRLRFYQVQRSNSNSLKLEFIARFMQFYNAKRRKQGVPLISRFDVIFVVPSGIDFTRPSITGFTKQQYSIVEGDHIPLLTTEEEGTGVVVRFKRLVEL